MERIKSRPSVSQDLVSTFSPEMIQAFLPKLPDPSSETWTFYVNEGIVAIGGIVGVPEVSMGEAWMIPTEAYYRHPLSSIAVRSRLKEVEERLGFIRYQMTASPDKPKNQRFIEWMGYQKEGVLRAWINGHDFIMYSKIRGEK